MKHLQPNEKHLADKLRHVPAPDVEQSWEQMRRLLDREMPEAAGAGWSGNGKWWWMGITAAVIMLALWLSQEFNQSTNAVAQKTATANSSQQSKASSAQTTSAAGNTAAPATQQSLSSTGSIATENNAPVEKENSQSQKINSGEQNTNAGGTTIAKNRNADDRFSVQPQANNAAVEKTVEKANSKIQQSNQAAGGLAADHHNNDLNRSSTGSPINRPGHTPASDARQLRRNYTKNPVAAYLDAEAEANKHDAATGRTKKNTAAGADNSIAAADIKQGGEALNDHDGTGNAVNNDALEQSFTRTSRQPGLAIVRRNLLRNDENTNTQETFSTIENTLPALRIVPGKTDREFVREARRKSMKADDRRMSRSSMRGNFGEKEHEITFAAGLTVPQTFAVSGQQSSPYNVSARNSRLTDYLPAPFFQYHINPKVFLQTEFHFQSPQYTQRLLLSRKETVLPGATNTSSVFLEKLYYFNIPLNVYYSPTRNFFVGGGLQYSSLLSGVASFENRQTQGSSQLGYSSVTQRFKDDSVAAVFAPSEWRYQFDANYYFNRFTLGMRYNRSMKDFVNIPTAQGRNTAFLLYLRFNIWEERRKE